MNSQATQMFEGERARLISLAYRMMGEWAAAEDVVQDAWLRWSKADHGGIQSPAAWLTTVTTRLAIDALTSARARREIYVGPWLPEADLEPWDGMESGSDHPGADIEQKQQVNLALMWAMERLAPEERAAFLLRDIFETDYADVAATLDRSEAACRQMVSRAKKRLEEDAPRFQAEPTAVSNLLERFMTATASLDKAEVLALLSPDVVAISDGGGKVSAALRPLEGADEVAQVWISVASRKPIAAKPKWVLANGQPALAILEGGEDDVVLSVIPGADGRIAWIYAMRNPEKLSSQRPATKWSD